MHRKVDAIAKKWEPKFAKAAAKSLWHDKRELVKRMEKKAEVEWTIIGREWDEYFEDFADEAWREEFMPLIEGLVTEQGESWNTTLGMQFNVRNYLAEAWLEDYMLTFAQDINNTTKQDVSSILLDAMQQGWGINRMNDGLGLLFDKYINDKKVDCSRDDLSPEEQWFCDRQPRYRRENISRTETMRSSNSGSHSLFGAMGAEKKEWWATGDDRTRDSHLIAWQKYSEGGNPGPILHDQYFEVGGARLMQPGDPNGPPDQTIQCRCTELPYMDAWAGTEEEIAAARADMDAEVVRREAVVAEPDKARETRGQIEAISNRTEQHLAELTTEVGELDKLIKLNNEVLVEMIEQGASMEHLSEIERRAFSWYDRRSLLRGEQRTIKKGIEQEIAELIYVNNPAKFRANYRRRAKNWESWEEGLSIFKRLVGTGTLDESEVTIRTTRKKRSYYLPYQDRVDMSTRARDRVMIHELGHWLEDVDRSVLDKAEKFYNKRTRGETEEWLGDAYDEHEKTRRDEFLHPYMGKIYKVEGKTYATEIVSMGLELIHYEPARLAKEDPEYFDFMYNLLRGQ